MHLADTNMESLPISQGMNIVSQYFCDVLDLLSDGIYISDREGRSIWVNKMYEKISKLNRQELLSKNVVDLREEGVFSVVLNPAIVATGKPQTSVQTNIKGQQLLLTGYPIFDERGEVALVITFVRDITLLSMLKEQITAQREIIDTFHDNFASINIREANLLPIITAEARVRQLMDFIAKVAPTDATVLLLGETGVGKDVYARTVHEMSPRRNKPFCKIDCTTIPETLIESELFGYAAGAFTNASAKGKAGFVEMADKGTLFLDEIGDLPLPMQGKLLRVLQDHEVVRVGSTQVRHVDVRVVAATNRDLAADVRKGSFRSDLYYRLMVAVAHIPPLRDRKADILPLAQYFLNQYGRKFHKECVLTPEVEALFLEYQWPGNIRELENMIQGLIITTECKTIRVTDLPPRVVGPLERTPCGWLAKFICNEESRSLKDIVKDIEREILRASLDHYGAESAVAQRFNIHRSTIFRKLNPGHGSGRQASSVSDVTGD